MPYEILGPDTQSSSGRYEILPSAEDLSFLNDPLGVIKAGVTEGITGAPARLGNLIAGGVKGATDIGTTLMDLARTRLGEPVAGVVPAQWRPPGVVDTGPTLNSLITGQRAQLAPTKDERSKAVDEALAALGADPSSMQYGMGRLAAQVAGTAGVGNALAAPLMNGGRVAQAVGTGLQTGGFSVPGLSGAPAWLARVGTGAVTGGASAGLVDPNSASTGAVIGAALPPAVAIAGKGGELVSDAMKGAANRLMQSAVKPTIAQLKSGDAQTAIQTLLDRGISPNPAGAEKLQSLIDSTDNQISNAIAGSSAQIDKANVLSPLAQARARFANQVSPQSDLNAIDNAASAFLNHPQYPGMTIPVQDAQTLKQGTYQILAKKYGQLGSADTEAQKALARGLKDEIAAAVPGISGLNAEQSRLLTTLQVAQRRALMESNKNPLGLAALSPSPHGLLAFLADRSAALKALGARGLYSAAPGANVSGLLGDSLALPLVRAGLLTSAESP